MYSGRVGMESGLCAPQVLYGAHSALWLADTIHAGVAEVAVQGGRFTASSVKDSTASLGCVKILTPKIHPTFTRVFQPPEESRALNFEITARSIVISSVRACSRRTQHAASWLCAYGLHILGCWVLGAG